MTTMGKRQSYVTAFDGSKVICKGNGTVTIDVCGKMCHSEVIVVDNLLRGIDVVLGMDVINKLGGVMVTGSEIQFGSQRRDCCSVVENDVEKDAKAMIIDDKNFFGEFDGEAWTVKWVWKGDKPPELKKI